ncbi:MAG: hypothetical protein ABIB71_05320 [Candidatus Woesearchaeota archaeon]
MKKLISMLLLVVLAVSVFSLTAAAANITMKVKVNNEYLDLGETLSVERGETLYVKASASADEDIDDVKFRAWISGYEDPIDDYSEMFNLKAGVTHPETLQLVLPSDMDAADEYKLYVEVEGKDGSLYREFIDLRIERTRHKLEILDIDVSPSLNVDAGDSVDIRVRARNTGDKKQEDIKVKVEVPDLGVYKKEYIEELCAYEDDDNDCEDSSWSPWISFTVSEDADGEYEAFVSVSYYDGRYENSEIVELNVKALKKEVAVEEEEAPVEIDSSIMGNGDSLISIAATTQSVEKGSEIAYKIKVANIGSAAKVYHVNIAGTKLWAETRAEPSFLSIDAGKTGEVYVYLKANEDAEPGSWPFTVQLLENDRLVKELELSAKVFEGNGDRVGVGFTKFLSENALKVAFVGLVVLILVVGLVAAVRKLRNGEDEEEFDVEGNEKGQGYY